MNEYTNTIAVSDFEKHIIGTLRKMQAGGGYGHIAFEFFDGQCVKVEEARLQNPHQLKDMNGNRRAR